MIKQIEPVAEERPAILMRAQAIFANSLSESDNNLTDAMRKIAMDQALLEFRLNLACEAIALFQEKIFVLNAQLNQVT